VGPAPALRGCAIGASPVTYRAIRELARAYAILVHQLLRRGRARRGLIFGVVDFRSWPQPRAGIEMTGETELHRHCFGLVGERHSGDRAMAGGAADAFGDVDAVVEIDIVGKVGDSSPDERLVGDEALAHRRKQLRIGPYLRMARHAGVGRRHSRIGRNLHGGVAEAAIDPETPNMMFVTERNRLLDRNAEATRGIAVGPKEPKAEAEDEQKGDKPER